MSTDIPTVDITKDLNQLYEVHGKALFKLIEDTTEAMGLDDDGRFFVDDFPIRYRQVGDDQGTPETLTTDVWEYFVYAAEVGAGHIAGRYVGAAYRINGIDEDKEDSEKPMAINYETSDLPELILILRGDYKL